VIGGGIVMQIAEKGGVPFAGDGRKFLFRPGTAGARPSEDWPLRNGAKMAIRATRSGGLLLGLGGRRVTGGVQTCD